MTRTPVVMALLILAATSATCSADCHHLYRPHHVHHAVVQQVVLYSTGEALVVEAKVAKEVERQLALRQERPAQQQTAVATSALNAKCLRCHNGTRDDTDFDLREPISDFHSTRTVEILSGINVPDKMKGVVSGLKDGDHGSITKEVLTRWRTERARPSPAKPEPQAVPPEPEPGVLR